MNKREQVIRGLKCCREMDNPAGWRVGGCYDCPYEPKKGKEGCTKALKDDAISLLKSQEPRVMTYAELNRLHIDDVIWLEDIDKAEVIPAIVCGAPDYSSVLDAVELCAYYRNKYISAITKDYLKRWRCWAAKPTREQREATPWQ